MTRSILYTILLSLPPAATWFVFLLLYGDSTNKAHWGYYLLLCPLTIYLLFFLSFFQRSKTVPKAGIWKKRFRLVCAVFILTALGDGLGGYFNRYLYNQAVQNDWRYTLYIHNWLEKNRFEIPPTSGDTAPGPFVPFVRGKLLDSNVTADRWGFRREKPDPYPALSPAETFNVLCLGGSVMFGMTYKQGDLAAPDMLQDTIVQDLPNTPIRIYNAAFPGVHAGSITTPEQTSYWQIRPNILFFYEAVNWLAPGQKSFLQNRNSLLMTWLRNRQVIRNTSHITDEYVPNEYGEKLELFIDQCHQNDPNAIPVLMTYSLPFTEHDPPGELAYWDRMQNGQGCAYAAAVLVQKHNEKLIEIAKKRGVPFIDTRPHLNGQPDYFIDSCHLTQEGTRILARLMADCIQNLLTDNTP